MTPKQERFVEEYLIDLNATQAAIRAGYSEKTADQQGHQLLKKASVAAAIEKARAEQSKRTQVTADMVVRELARVGFSDVRKLLTDSDTLRPISTLDDETAAAVASVEIVAKPGGVDEDGNRMVEHVHKIKLWDKNSALEKLGKHLGMFTERVEHSGPDGGPIETRDMSDLEFARKMAFLLRKGAEGVE